MDLLRYYQFPLISSDTRFPNCSRSSIASAAREDPIFVPQAGDGEIGPRYQQLTLQLCGLELGMYLQSGIGLRCKWPSWHIWLVCQTSWPDQSTPHTCRLFGCRICWLHLVIIVRQAGQYSSWLVSYPTHSWLKQATWTTSKPTIKLLDVLDAFLLENDTSWI